MLLRKPWRTGLLGLGLAASLSGSASAQAAPAPSAPPPLTWAKAMALTEQHPRVTVALQEVRAAEGAVLQAGMRPNPMVGLSAGVENLNLLESVGLTLSQELELGGKRQARLLAARAELQEAELRLGEARRLLRNDAKLALAQLLFAQEAERIRRQGADMALAQAELGRQRLARGDVAGVEVVQLETDAQRRLATWEEARGLRRARAGALAALLGQGADPELLVQGQLGRPTGPLELASLAQLALQERPDLAAARARTDARRARVAVEETKGISNLTVQAGITRERTFIQGDAVSPRGVIEHIDESFWVAGLSLKMPLPIFDTNEGNIVSARARVEGAAADEERLEREILSDVASAYERLQAARAVRARLQVEVLPRAERSLSLVEQAYRLGSRTVVDLLVARQAFLDAQTAELEAARAEEEALVALEAAVGRELTREVSP